MMPFPATDVFVGRSYRNPRVFHEQVHGNQRLRRCMDLHRAEWLGSLSALDGRRSLCHFRAVDAESMRLALHAAEMPYDWLFAGALQTVTGGLPEQVNLVAERWFIQPLEERQAVRFDALIKGYLAGAGARLSHTIRSNCGHRWLYLCRSEHERDTAVAAARVLLSRGFALWPCSWSGPGVASVADRAGVLGDPAPRGHGRRRLASL